MDCGLTGSSVHEISQTSILEWIAISCSKGFSPPKDWTCVSCISWWILWHGATWEPVLSYHIIMSQLSSVQSVSHVWLFATPWTAACQASLSITNSWSLLKLTSIESVITSNHLVICRPLLLLPSVFPGIRVFSDESVLHIRWPKYWSFSFSLSPSQSWIFRTDLL